MTASPSIEVAHLADEGDDGSRIVAGGEPLILFPEGEIGPLYQDAIGGLVGHLVGHGLSLR